MILLEQMGTSAFNGRCQGLPPLYFNIQLSHYFLKEVSVTHCVGMPEFTPVNAP